MKFLRSWISALMIAGFIFPGCASIRHQELPVHEQVLVYPLPYDLTFLRTLEAIEKVPHWELVETEKPKGIIRARNLNYSNLVDADLRSATVVVSRIGRRETSVALAEHSQRVIGGGEILQKINEYVSAELR